MARHPTTRRSNGAVRREAKRWRAANARWMHLGAGAMGVRRTLQHSWAQHVLQTTSSVFLAAYAVTLRQIVNQPAVTQALQPLVDYQVGRIATYGQLAADRMFLDRALHDIPLVEYLQAMEFRPREHLRIGSLANDTVALKMTGFNIHQLERLYRCFALREFCQLMGDTHIRVGTRHYKNGRENCYRFDPEELFLFGLTKCKTGESNVSIIDNWFGGDYARWSFGFYFFVMYLDGRYLRILGHGGLLRYLPEFPRFRDAMERYCQRDRVYHDHQGNTTIVPGLERLPFNIGLLIDNTVDPTRAPFSGPDGDYEGAPRRALYMDAQESIWSGYKKVHGIKLETVYMPNGISTLFGGVSCRANDRGTLGLSGLDRFLAGIQADVPPHLRIMAFGDSIYRGLLQYITTYFRAIPPNQLTVPELRCNGAFRALRIPIERNYGQTSCVQRICDTARSYQLGKRHPYALEQLRVCHLLMNCYICLNGDQGSSVNTFACSPPRLEDYLRL